MSGLSHADLAKLLGQRSKAELIEWILEQATQQEGLQRALLNLVAPQADVETLVSELCQIITRAWGRIRSSREPWKLARPIAADLQPVLTAVEQLLARGQAVAAEKVLARFVHAAEKGFDHVDDSYGYLGPLCQEAVTLWGKAWAGIEPRDPRSLAKMVLDGLQDNGYGLCDHMIGDFAPALGCEGLLLLKKTFLADHAAKAADAGGDEWRRQEPLRHLADVADAMQDVELYIDIQRRCGQLDAYALPIARRLLEAGRPAEALEYLDRGDHTRPYFHGEKDDAVTLRVKILQTLGRDGEARTLLWQEFQRGLGTATLEQLTTLTPPEQRQTLAEQAIAAAAAHPDRVTAALFLVDRGHVARAAALVTAHPDRFDGRCYTQLLALAEVIQESFPTAAWVLYRALLLSILEERRSKAYYHAADYLRLAEGLAARAGLQAKHQELQVLLRAQHGRKHAFWNHLQR